MCIAFDFLDVALERVLMMLLSLRFISHYPIGVEKLAQTTHKLFLRIIRADIDRNATLAEAVLKNLGNIEAGIRSYHIYVGEQCLGEEN